MKKKWNLRTFLLVILALGVITSLTWEHVLLNPVRLEQVVFGPLTAGANKQIDGLTVDELRFAVARQEIRDHSDKTLIVENATIERHGTSVDAPRDVPIIGRAELRRTVYKCLVDGEYNDGARTKRIFFVEKQQYHMLD